MGNKMYRNIGKVKNEIFRAYDIRGLVPSDLNEDVVFNIGLSFGSEAQSQGEKIVIIARDGRLSGPCLLKSLSNGLLASGCDIVNIGAVPTPVLYFATHLFKTGTGIMLTGSHNPKDYNGLKMLMANDTFAIAEINVLKSRIFNNSFISGNGSVINTDIKNDYINYILKQEKLDKKLKIVVDAGIGIAGEIALELFVKLGCEIIPMYCDVDGSFPNHDPDPSKPKNLKDLIAKVKETKADVGLAFDGDGDRLGVVTNSGDIIFADRQIMIYAKDIITNSKDQSVFLYDVKCTKNLKNFIHKLGGKSIMYKTGHSLIKKKLKQTKIDFAGEMSGHMFFNDRWLGFDDALYTGVRLLEIISKTDRSVDELFAELPDSFSTPELNIDVKEEFKFIVIDDLIAIAKKDFANYKIVTIDGLRVEFESSWALVRASNTTPCLVLRFEADSQEELEYIQQKFTTLTKSVIGKYQS